MASLLPPGSFLPASTWLKPQGRNKLLGGLFLWLLTTHILGVHLVWAAVFVNERGRETSVFRHPFGIWQGQLLFGPSCVYQRHLAFIYEKE